MRVKILRAIVVLAISLTANSSVFASFVPNYWYPGDGSGGGGSCTVSNCQTTCTGPTGVECCCYYSCPSGNTWVCKSGYCDNTDRGCL